MTTWYESQVKAHDIDSYSCKDETDTDPETPISMCALPIRNGVFMINCKRPVLAACTEWC